MSKTREVTMVTADGERVIGDAGGTGAALDAIGADRAWYVLDGRYVLTIGGSGGAECDVESADVPANVRAALEVES